MKRLRGLGIPSALVLSPACEALHIITNTLQISQAWPVKVYRCTVWFTAVTV